MSVYVSVFEFHTSHLQLDVLPEIVDEVKDKIEIYLDGGIRNGSDVFKALALGARAVFLGRPVLWGLVHNVSMPCDVESCFKYLCIMFYVSCFIPMKSLQGRVELP